MARPGARAVIEMEFANTRHVLNGLLELGRPEGAHDYLIGEIDRYRRLWRADELIAGHGRPPVAPQSKR